jgi:hypothetical protein
LPALIKAINRNVGSLFLFAYEGSDFGHSQTRRSGEAPSTIGIAMASEDLRDVRPAYVRFLLLLLGEAIVGVFLYAVFTFMPMAVQIVIVVPGWVVTTAIPVFSCGFAWGITHEDVWSKLPLRGACLMAAALMFLDRRADAAIRSFAKNAQDVGCGLPLRSRPQSASS